ncbi:MAG: lytic transglycosylase domain-containing protein [Alphaproteobacteria bacterium]|nr:MAG: lytic transglycosylase domain-containing protein [Alphaproteobacteria bacterium]
MRRFEFATACLFACLFYFADLAPGTYEPASAAVAADPVATARLEAEPARTTIDAEPVPLADDFDLREPQDVNPEAPASEARKRTSLERARAALAESTATALSDQELCTTLVEVARRNDLPLGFFTNLIWRESRFDHDAISPVGAMGIAQFMPDVADKMSVDAFDSRSALPASAQLLRTLRARFGNLGLAAAAYNAGPKRVLDWLEGRGSLPRETQDYVLLITGRPATHWQKSQTAVYRVPRQVPCHRTETFASAEQLQRAQQERIVAEEARIAELKAREAAARRLAELKQKSQKSKDVPRSARLQIAARVQATKSAAASQVTKAAAAPRQAKIRVAQLKR